MRRPDWVKQLHETIEAAAQKPFDYGAYNCGLFAAECIDAMTGEARAAELRSQFTDEASAKAFVGAAGGIEGAVTARLGFPFQTWGRARRGDVCLVMTQDGPGLGICVGTLIVMMTPGAGLTHVRIDEALKVWRVD